MEKYDRLGVPDLDMDILQYKPEFSDAKEAVAFARNVFGVYIDKMEDLVILFASMCVYISAEELSFALGLSKQRSSAYLTALCKKKGKINPVLKEVSMDEVQGQTRKFFGVTSDGHKKAMQIFNGLSLSKYKSKRSLIALIHTYGAGMNAFHVFMSGIPFRWEREVTPNIGSKYYKGVSNLLQIDAICHLWYRDKKLIRRIYFEEDTGTETRKILVQKLEKYVQYGYMQDINDIIFFSFFKSGVSLSYSSVSEMEYLHKLEKLLDEYNASDALILYNQHKSTLGDRFIFFLQNFLLQTGCAVMKNGELLGTDIVCDSLFVHDYIRTSSAHVNPWKLRELNERHNELCASTLRAFVIEFIESFALYPAYTVRMLKGYRIYCCPTQLCADAVRYSCLSLDASLQEKVISSLSGLFGDVSYKKDLYGVVMDEKLTVDKINLRDNFTFERDGFNGNICVEFPCYDAGAWIRLWYFIRHKKKDPVSVLCVFNTRQQAVSFFSMLAYSMEHLSVQYKGSEVYGILRGDLGRDGKIFSAVKDYESDDYELFDVAR